MASLHYTTAPYLKRDKYTSILYICATPHGSMLSEAAPAGYQPLGLGLNRWLAAGSTDEGVHVSLVRDALELLPSVFKEPALGN